MCLHSLKATSITFVAAQHEQQHITIVNVQLCQVSLNESMVIKVSSKATVLSGICTESTSVDTILEHLDISHLAQALHSTATDHRSSQPRSLDSDLNVPLGTMSEIINQQTREIRLDLSFKEALPKAVVLNEKFLGTTAQYFNLLHKTSTFCTTVLSSMLPAMTALDFKDKKLRSCLLCLEKFGFEYHENRICFDGQFEKSNININSHHLVQSVIDPLIRLVKSQGNSFELESKETKTRRPTNYSVLFGVLFQTASKAVYKPCEDDETETLIARIRRPLFARILQRLQPVVDPCRDKDCLAQLVTFLSRASQSAHAGYGKAHFQEILNHLHVLLYYDDDMELLEQVVAVFCDLCEKVFQRHSDLGVTLPDEDCGMTRKYARKRHLNELVFGGFLRGALTEMDVGHFPRDVVSIIHAFRHCYRPGDVGHLKQRLTVLADERNSYSPTIVGYAKNALKLL